MPANSVKPTSRGNSKPACSVGRYSLATRSRKALLMTLTEESAMAAAPIIGDSSKPKAG
jgi:hypothetical protein